MQTIQQLIQKLKAENKTLADEMYIGGLSDYAHTVKVHRYNHNLEIIKELENTK